MNQDLLNYITAARDFGTSDHAIKMNLQAAGWKIEEIYGAFDHLDNKKTHPQEEKIHPKQEKEIKKIPLPKTLYRFWADIVDALMIYIILTLLGSIFRIISHPATKNVLLFQRQTALFNSVFGIILWIIYTTYFLSQKGTTMGKDAYGLKVIQFGKDENISVSQAIVREIVRIGVTIIPVVGPIFFIINVIYVAISKDKRGFHDLVARTQVVQDKKMWVIKDQIGCALVFLIPLLIIFFLSIIFPIVALK